MCSPAACQCGMILIKRNNITTITSFYCTSATIHGAIQRQTVIKRVFLFLILLARESGTEGWGHLALCLQAHQRNIKCLWLIYSELCSSIISSESIRVAVLKYTAAYGAETAPVSRARGRLTPSLCCSCCKC